MILQLVGMAVWAGGVKSRVWGVVTVGGMDMSRRGSELG